MSSGQDRIPIPDEIDFGTLNREVSEVVASACLRYLNATHYRIKQRAREAHHAAVIQQRNSALYRFQALGFHLSWLSQLQDKYTALMTNEGIGGRNDRGHLRAAATESLYVLDDIVFNAASMCDYWAGLVAAVFLGPHRHTTKWNQLAKISLASGGATPGQALEAPSTLLRVKHLHADWVDALFAYRSDVIHTSSEKIDGAVVRNWTPELKVHLEIPVPPKLRRKMAFLLDDGEKEGLALMGAVRLYMRCYYALVDLGLSLAADVRAEYGAWDPLARYADETS